MKPEIIIKRLKEEFFLTDDFSYIVEENCVSIPLSCIIVFSSRAIARCHFPYWVISTNYLYIHFHNL